MKPCNEFKPQRVRECAPATQIIETSEPAAGHPPVRQLKIEAEGDFWKGRIKPKIRLMGRWLERAGFAQGNRVHVTCLAPGVIELRSADAPE
jgi:hypothetical protein